MILFHEDPKGRDSRVVVVARLEYSIPYSWILGSEAVSLNHVHNPLLDAQKLIGR